MGLRITMKGFNQNIDWGYNSPVIAGSLSSETARARYRPYRSRTQRRKGAGIYIQRHNRQIYAARLRIRWVRRATARGLIQNYNKPADAWTASKLLDPLSLDLSIANPT